MDFIPLVEERINLYLDNLLSKEITMFAFDVANSDEVSR